MKSYFYLILSCILMTSCSSTTLYHASLPVLKPQATIEEIGASRERDEIEFADVSVYAMAPVLYYVVKRSYGLEQKKYPDIPVFEGPPFGLNVGMYIKSGNMQFDPYKVALELP
jgi:hypothetical protein